MRHFVVNVAVFLAGSRIVTFWCFTGGTRFIGVYLARQLVEEGHDVTLLTRGKAQVTFQIPDDTDAAYKQYAGSVKHIAADRKDRELVKDKLSGSGFEGTNTC